MIATLAVLFHLVGALWIAKTVPFPSTIDELQHLSYIHDMSVQPELFPRFDRMLVLSDDLGARSDTPNYLNHPSPYYHLMALSDDPTAPRDSRILRLRLLNLLLSCTGLVLILRAGARLFPTMTAFTVFAAVLVMFPKLAVIGGLINNDNLGILAAGLGFAGLSRLHRERSLGGATMLAIALALAGWTKLTVLVMIGFATLAAELLTLRKDAWRGRLLTLGILALGGFVAIVPTLQNMFVYGSVLFTSEVHNYVAPAERPALDFTGFQALFLRDMLLKWSALEPAHWIHILGLGFVLASGVLVVARHARSRFEATATIAGPQSASTLVAASYAFAFVGALAVHAIFGWLAFQAIGDTTSAQPRYYYALWPGLALGATLICVGLPAGRVRSYAVIGATLALFLATSQFAALSMWLRASA